MNGFKDGASADDPFSDDSDDGDNDDSGHSGVDESRTDTTTEPDTTARRDDDVGGTAATTDTTEESGSDGLPWIYQRNSITDGRPKTVQLHLQESTLREQRDARSDIETRLGETVQKADLREAALLVGLQNLDDVSTQLREWGYDV